MLLRKKFIFLVFILLFNASFCDWLLQGIGLKSEKDPFKRAAGGRSEVEFKPASIKKLSKSQIDQFYQRYQAFSKKAEGIKQWKDRRSGYPNPILNKEKVEEIFWPIGNYSNWSKFFKEIFDTEVFVDPEERKKELLNRPSASADKQQIAKFTQKPGKLDERLAYLENKIQECKSNLQEREDLKKVLRFYNDDMSDLCYLSEEIIAEASVLQGLYQAMMKLIGSIGVCFVFEKRNYGHSLFRAKIVPYIYIALVPRKKKLGEVVKSIGKFRSAIDEIRKNCPELESNYSWKPKYFPFQELGKIIEGMDEFARDICELIESWVEHDNKEIADFMKKINFYDFLKENYRGQFKSKPNWPQEFKMESNLSDDAEVSDGSNPTHWLYEKFYKKIGEEIDKWYQIHSRSVKLKLEEHYIYTLFNDLEKEGAQLDQLGGILRLKRILGKVFHPDSKKRAFQFEQDGENQALFIDQQMIGKEVYSELNSFITDIETHIKNGTIDTLKNNL